MRHRTPVRRALTTLGLTLATLAVAVASSVTPAAAAPSTAKPDPAIAAAFQRIATGTYSSADIALIKSRPELAAAVMDPTQATFTTSVEQAAPVEVTGLKADGVHPNISTQQYCGWIEIRITAYSLLGFKFFSWTHHAGYCTDLDVIRRWNGRYDKMNYADPTINMLERKVDYFSHVPTYEATSTMQRHLQQCVLTYGCWANWYPWSTITIYPDGYFNWSWGVA